MFRRRNTTTPNRIPVFPSEDTCHVDFLYDRAIRFHMKNGSTDEAVILDEDDFGFIVSDRHLLARDEDETRRGIPRRGVAFMEYM